MTQQTAAQAAEASLRTSYQEHHQQSGYYHPDEINEAFDQNLTLVRGAVVDDVTAFLDTVYQGKAADLIRAKARAGRFVNGSR